MRVSKADYMLLEKRVEKLARLNQVSEIERTVRHEVMNLLKGQPERRLAAHEGISNAYDNPMEFWIFVDKLPMRAYVELFIEAGRKGRAPTMEEMEIAERLNRSSQ